MAAQSLPERGRPHLFARVVLAVAAATCAHAGFNYTACLPSGTSVSAVAVGQRVNLCLRLNGNATAVFNPVVDEHTAVQVSGSNFALPTGTGYMQDGVGRIDNLNISAFNCSIPAVRKFHVVLDVSVMNTHSAVPRLYKTVTTSGCGVTTIDTIPIQVVIIGLSSGFVDYIAWDDGCVFCADNGADCVNYGFETSTNSLIADSSIRSCRSTYSACYSSTTSSTNASTPVNATTATTCDLKLFIVWTGTDAKGNYLTSVNRRVSRFRQFGTATLAQSTYNMGMQGMNLAQTSVSYATSIPDRVTAPSTEQIVRRLERDGADTHAVAVAAAAAVPNP